jgi:hypothetical protein
MVVSCGVSTAGKNLEQDVPRTDWDRMSQLHEEVSRKMRDTAGGTPALPFEEAASSFSYPITNHK